jgi:membrane glycosyltransferase
MEILLLALFVACFVWIAFSFWAALAGFALLAFGARQPGLVRATPARRAEPLRARNAVVMAIYNEEPSRVFGTIEAMAESLAATGQGEAFDFYVLSDSTDPDAWIAETMAWHALTLRLGRNARVFYRRRRQNTAKKAGNIADFCERWGRHYPHMIVLDADSVMDGATLVEMARLMELNPGAGLIQVPPMCVNRNTLFARMLQFAGRIYGPVFAAGQAFWQIGDGNYYGHNAIVRTAAFTEHCGLPVLPGKPPFGGHILSHDFVEAALLRRAGWTVWMLPDLGGSYEEVPPTLLDYVKRDQRWAQGNLQHARILGAWGLHPVSRFHLLSGIFSYLSSPLWFAFLAVGLAIALVNTLILPPYFGSAKQLFPDWPVFDSAMAQGLFGAALAFLLIPRLLGLTLSLADRRVRRAAGGAVRMSIGALLELAYSTLLAPTMMLFQTIIVSKILTGRTIEWGTQNRGDQGIRWGAAFRAHISHTVFGLVVGIGAFVLQPQLFYWLSPLVLGLLVAVPIAQWSSRRDVGAALRRLGLFLIPEETAPPRVLVQARHFAAAIEAAPKGETSALARVLVDPLAMAVHRLQLETLGEAPTPESPELAMARTKLAQAQALTRAETLLLLYDRRTLDLGAAALPRAA